MNDQHGPVDRLEARLERLTARVDELSRIVELGAGARPESAEPKRSAAHELARRKRRRHVGHASRI